MLELRIAEHLPSYIHLKNGNRLHEPPSVEGFLERIKPGTQTKQPLYISTHNGNLFVLPAHKANPPAPPGFAQNGDDLESYAKNLRKMEAERGIKQIMNATGVTDLRTILLIRRASHPVYQPTHNEPLKNENDIWFDIWSQSEARTPNDESDVGGEEGLKASEDKIQLRIQRSFELLLVTGKVVRFEVNLGIFLHDLSLMCSGSFMPSGDRMDRTPARVGSVLEAETPHRCEGRNGSRSSLSPPLNSSYPSSSRS